MCGKSLENYNQLQTRIEMLIKKLMAACNLSAQPGCFEIGDRLFAILKGELCCFTPFWLGPTAVLASYQSATTGLRYLR